MKIFLIIFSVISFANAPAQIGTNELQNQVFGLGEELTYKATFLGLNVGTAVTRVDKVPHKILGHSCYKVEVSGSTSEWISWVTRVQDTWVAYLDTTQFLTRATYRRIREGRHRKDEWVTYNQTDHKASVQV